jgi:lysozyme
MPTINPAGMDLVESFEGCQLTAYRDSGGVWTIGYGHTGDDVHPGETITQVQADALLESDLTAAEHEVASLIEVVMTPNEFSALVSFQFNTGALGDSAGLPLLNAREFPEAWDDHFCLYIHDAQGNELEGLVRRRAAERELFFRV